MGFARLCMGAVAEHVFRVLCHRSPSKIPNEVVSRVSVEVSNHLVVTRRPDKGAEDQAVNVGSLEATAARKLQASIAVDVDQAAKSLSPLAEDPALVADQVQVFPANDRSPLFDAG